MSLLLAFLLAALLFFVTITLVLFFIGPILLLQPKRRTAAFYRNLGLPVSPEEIKVPYEEIIIRTNDGLKLNSWLLKASAPAKGTILYLHGVGDCKIDGLRFAKLMHDHHFNVFLYDARRHGQSEGTYCTYGYDEKYDVLKIIDYLQSRTDMNPGKIGIFGTSMGGLSRYRPPLSTHASPASPPKTHLRHCGRFSTTIRSASSNCRFIISATSSLSAPSSWQSSRQAMYRRSRR
jgi:hypothetical protein